MALKQNYYHLWFESFILEKTSGHKSEIQLKLVPNQKLPSEITNECNKKSTDPYSLITACNTDLFNNYSIGTKFLLKAKLNDREKEGLFFYSYFGWEPLEITLPQSNA